MAHDEHSISLKIFLVLGSCIIVRPSSLHRKKCPSSIRKYSWTLTHNPNAIWKVSKITKITAILVYFVFFSFLCYFDRCAIVIIRITLIHSARTRGVCGKRTTVSNFAETDYAAGKCFVLSRMAQMHMECANRYFFALWFIQNLPRISYSNMSVECVCWN